MTEPAKFENNGTKFEREICDRCGGIGSFSYNRIDGSRCYGCGGSGVRLSKTGKEARRLFEAKIAIESSKLSVGDVVFVRTIGPPRKRTVQSIAPSNDPISRLEVEFGTPENSDKWIVTPEYTFESANPELRARAYAEALEWQREKVSRRKAPKPAAEAAPRA